MKAEDRLQAGLERQDTDVPNLSDEERELVALANRLRTVKFPSRNPATMAAQRTALVQAVPTSKGGRMRDELTRWGIPLALAGGGVAILLICLVTLGIGGVWWRSQPTEVVQPPAKLEEHETYTSFVPFISGTNPHESHEARVQDVRGLVEVLDDAETWTPVHAGSDLVAGQRLRTGALSSASLRFPDGSQASLGARAEITIDTLATADGPRTIVLVQDAGESLHIVSPTKAPGARYVVRTPTGEGAATGTVFGVTVSAGQRSRFSVDEGTVEVSSNGSTVQVTAGEVSTVDAEAPPSPPVFRISGTGELTAMGEVWTIGGQDFVVPETTTIVGEPQLGDWVHVEGRLLPDDTRIADSISLVRRAPVDRFELVGVVEAIDATAWTVAGQSIVVDAETEIDAAIELGDWARVVGLIKEGGELRAETIRRIEPDRQPFEFVGVVQSIAADLWVISGAEITVNGETELDGDIAPGDVVKVEGWVQEDGSWLATEIKLEPEPERNFEIVGALESMAPWVVAGLDIKVGDWTEIEEGLEEGDIVKVEGLITEEGVWVAYEIEQVEPPTTRLVFVGVVESRAPWIVSGIELVTDDQTAIEDGIEVGDLVKVEIELRPDGTWITVSIRLLPVAEDPPGVGGEKVTLCHKPNGNNPHTITVAAPAVAAHLAHGDTLGACESAIETPFPEAPPAAPPDAEEQVTICHKPNGPHPQTLTIPRSALPAHLGHGDTMGACP